MLKEPEKTVIAGCRGRMGAMLMARGRSAGLKMAGIDLPYGEAKLDQVLAGAALVILCVPAAAFAATLAAICPAMPPQAVLADIASVKEGPLRQMRAAWPGAVVGTHPLFGPRVELGQDLPVALTPAPGTGEGAIEMVAGFFRALGCRVFLARPDEHDRAMARIQNMNFITSLAYFALLARHEELLPYITPSFRRRMEAARKMLTEDAELFSGLFEANAYSHEAVRQYRKMLALAASGDVDLLCQLASWWWPKDGLAGAITPRTRRRRVRPRRRQANFNKLTTAQDKVHERE